MLDWPAIDALGTWVIGLAATALAIMTYRRDAEHRQRDASEEAALHLTHAQDVLASVVRSREACRTLQASAATGVAGGTNIESIRGASDSVSQIQLADPARSAISDLYLKLLDANSCLASLGEALARQSSAEDFATIEEKARACVLALSTFKRELDQRIRKLSKIARL